MINAIYGFMCGGTCVALIVAAIVYYYAYKMWNNS